MGVDIIELQGNVLYPAQGANALRYHERPDGVTGVLSKVSFVMRLNLSTKKG